jgi:hypothetical protein
MLRVAADVVVGVCYHLRIASNLYTDLTADSPSQ